MNKITANKINVHAWKNAQGKPCRYRFSTEGGSLTWVEKVDARCKRLLNPLEEPVSLHIRFSLSRLPSETVPKISPRNFTFKRDCITSMKELLNSKLFLHYKQLKVH